MPTGLTARIKVALFLLLMLIAAFIYGLRVPIALQDGQPVTGPVGIIVLGGGLSPFLQDPKLDPSTAPVTRVAETIRLARAFPAAMVVYTGREAAPGPLPTLLRAEIAPRRIIWEDRSETTAQNAVFLAKLIRPHPEETWLLVTDDWHMARAARCFRRAGFLVTPTPIRGQMIAADSIWRPYREAVGQLAYTILGLCNA